MKKRHPKLLEQLRGKPGFHLDKAAEGKFSCFGWERCPKILHHCWQHTCRQDGAFTVHLFNFLILWQLFWSH